jgi:hypothetical protein
MAVTVERIRIPGEDELHFWEVKNGVEDEDYVRLMRRLRPMTNDLGLPVETMMRSFSREVKSVVFTSRERSIGALSDSLRLKLKTAGFVHLQSGLWVLPPYLTPQDLGSGDLETWFNALLPDLAKDISGVAYRLDLVELSRDSADTSQVRRLVLGALEVGEILPAKFVYEYLKSHGISLRDLIAKGDLVFLASAFADQETLSMLQKNKPQATSRVMQLSPSVSPSLQTLSELPVDWLASALDGFVPHPQDFAQRLKIEAFHWKRLLE